MISKHQSVLWNKRALRVLSILSLITASWLTLRGIQLWIASGEPVGVYFVLGGSPYREVQAAQLAKQHPEIPVLISSGSPEPCIFLMFKKLGAPVNNVWTEQCARNTFE